MSWDRSQSRIESLTVKALQEMKSELSLADIVSFIEKTEPSFFHTKTPKNSIYSVLYKREKRREKLGQKLLFESFIRNDMLYYRLNK